MELDNIDDINKEIKEYFQIGRKLNIIRLFHDDPESYPSYVKDVGEDAILIDIPTKFGVRVPAYEEDIIEITVMTEEGAYSAEVVVLEVETGQIAGLWVNIPDALERVQRRDFKRWKINFPLKLLVLKGDKVIEEISGECFDISGSGIAVTSKYSVPHDNSLKIKFQYKDIDANLMAKFIHIRYDFMKKHYITGLQFMDIERTTTDQIHKAGILFELEQRRKGLI